MWTYDPNRELRVSERQRASATIADGARAYGEDLAYAVSEDSDVADAVRTVGHKRANAIYSQALAGIVEIDEESEDES